MIKKLSDVVFSNKYNLYKEQEKIFDKIWRQSTIMYDEISIVSNKGGTFYSLK